MQLQQSFQQFYHMTPTKTECSAQTYPFGQLDRRQVVADFSGGTITSDGGLILVAQIDQHYRMSERVAECFADQRDPSRVQHELSDLIALSSAQKLKNCLYDGYFLAQSPLLIVVGALESNFQNSSHVLLFPSLNEKDW